MNAMRGEVGCGGQRCPGGMPPAAAGLVALVLGVMAGAAQAQTLTVAGDGKDLWLVVAPKQDQDHIEILHRRATDPAKILRRVSSGMSGRLVPGGAVTAHGRLWLVYRKDMTVQSVMVQPDRGPMRGRYDQPQMQPPLPRGVRLRSLAPGRQGPWALVQVKDPRTLQRIDAPAPEDKPSGTGTQGSFLIQERRPYVQPDPRGGVGENEGANSPESTDAASDQEASGDHEPSRAGDRTSPTTPAPGAQRSTPGAPSEPDKAPAIPVDRLLHLEGRQWTRVNLPEDWPWDASGWVVMPQVDDPFPLLLTAPIQDWIHVYHHQGGQWHKREYVLETEGKLDLQPMAVDGQLIIGRRLDDPNELTVALTIMRGESLSQLGHLTITNPPTRTWALAATGDHVGLFTIDQEGNVLQSSMDLRGQITASRTPLQLERQPNITQDPNRMLVAPLLAVSMLLMLLVWRRNPVANKLELSAKQVLAPLGRRAVAGAIDLAPPLLLVMAYEGKSLAQLPTFWPGLSGQWHAMLPGLGAIVMFVGHTMLGELLTGRSLGKALIGLRVSTMTGQRPRAWQVITRSLLKAFDLIVLLLPILVLIGRYRQRLGDMIARTVVIMDVDEHDDQSHDNRRQDND